MHGLMRPQAALPSLSRRWLEWGLETDWPYARLIALCLVLWLPGFFTIPPGDRDESRFAQATKQMLESGDVVSIRNGEVARNQKPIGIYWLQLPGAALARATGIASDNPIWPYRLPSLAGGLLGVCATFGFGQILVGRRAALLGAMMLAASIVLLVEVHTAKTDAALLGVTTVAMGLLGRAYLSPQEMGRRHWMGFWVAVAGGILLKGPITPMVAGLTVGTLTVADWISRRSRPGWLRRLHSARGFGLMLLLVLPWFVAIAWRTGGGFFADSVGGDLGGKLAGGEDAHGAPPGMHLLLLSLTMFPSGWVIFAALPAAWRARRLPAMRFLLAWVVPAWLVFELVPTKLPHYTLPLYPALCLLGAAWALEPQPLPRWLRQTAIGLSVAAACVLGGLAGVLPFVVGAAPDHRLLGVPALVAAGLVGWLILRRDFAAALLAAPLLIWSFFALELPGLPQLWIAPQVAAVLREHWPEGIAFASSGYAEPSLMFLCGTGTKWLGPEDAARFLQSEDARAVLVSSRDQPAFAAEAHHLGLVPQPVATIDGYNYSRGRAVQLEIYTNHRPAQIP
jgi:4-amino-4-deoxy-L-arabinose transferase-like glycosyltransferase